MKFSGWGNTSAQDARLISIDGAGRFAERLRARDSSFTSFALPRGNGRSYGNQAIPIQHAGSEFEMWSSRRLDHFLGFDDNTGVLKVEAGVTLGEIQRLFIPRGWALAVTPGTSYVTVGGAIANDVHGKNHHSHGTFGEHVVGLTLLRTDGSTLECSDHENADFLRATIGGMGLTGMVLNASIRLRKVASAWIDAEAIPFHGLQEFWQLTSESAESEYTVSWVEIQKRSVRGIFNRGNQSIQSRPEPRFKNLAVPFTPPISLFNTLTSKVLSQAYWSLGNAKSGSNLVHYRPFFYPLDSISDWNRAYGSRGFVQHQALIPKAAAEAGLFELIAAVAESGQRSAVSVLKTTGERVAPGMLTYPIEGVTLALDFAATKRAFELLSRLDEITVAHGGRVNPSKHPNLSKQVFEQSFSAKVIDDFSKWRDPGIESAQSEQIFESNQRKP